MKQIIQDLKDGKTILEEVPVPQTGSQSVLIRTHHSLVSLGTEKMLVSFGQAGLLDKARQQPEKVKEVLNKMKTDGVVPTVEAVFRKLGTPMPLGYSQSGTVVQVGSKVTEFKVGDRVISNGPHAEYVSVPENLTAKIPDNVTFEEASFTVVGAIALQGLRLASPTLGETVVVTGLGLIGLITAQLLKSNGCRVIGIDFDERKIELAKSFGIEAFNASSSDPVTTVETITNGVGADAVIITASTKSNDVIKQAATMSRKRGRIILVGVIGLQLDRADFYEKELTFQVSCSYGPGRYDPVYEKKGMDFPLPFVRWTEKRNFEAVLQAISSGSLNVKPLITERVKLEEYNSIYENISDSSSIASILEYQVDNATTDSSKKTRTIKVTYGDNQSTSNTIAVVGAGNFTQGTILPALKTAGASLKYISSSAGLSSTTLAKKYDVPFSTTDLDEITNDSEVGAVVITTQHNMHASMTERFLSAGKDVFVEKPLALTFDELERVDTAVQSSGRSVIVGFNRRFSPHVKKIQSIIGLNPGPMSVVATMNAGSIPKNVWVHDMELGGGRIIGEACHYLDLLVALTGSMIKSISMQALGSDPKPDTDVATIHLKFENGSIGVINYFANGNKSYPKERVEVFYQGKNFVIDNFRKTYGYGVKKGFSLSNTLLNTKQDKGHQEQFNQLVSSWKNGGTPIIPYDQIYNVSKATLCAIQSLQEGKPIIVL